MNPTFAAAASGTRGGTWPPVPPRAQLLSAQCNLQGLVVNTQEFGALPWFWPAIGWLNLASDRQEAYKVCREYGDKAACVVVSGAYYYGTGQTAYANVPGRDYAYDIPALRALLTEIIQAGFYVRLMFAGDGESVNANPQQGQYNDPNGGMTYGHQWVMQNFARIYAGLSGWNGEGRDLTEYIIPYPGFDGCVPGWQPPSQVDAFAFMARGTIGSNRAMGLLLSAGYCVWAGTEFNNWATTAGQCFDQVALQYPTRMGPPGAIPREYLDAEGNWLPTTTADQRAPWDQVWQVTARCVADYQRPAEQPPNDDPGGAPNNLAGGTPRGPYYVDRFEYDTYWWTRWGVTPEVVQTHRRTLQALSPSPPVITG